MDFGIDKKIDLNSVEYDQIGITQNMDTPIYRRQEQTKSIKDTTVQMDIYSLDAMADDS